MGVFRFLLPCVGLILLTTLANGCHDKKLCDLIDALKDLKECKKSCLSALFKDKKLKAKKIFEKGCDECNPLVGSTLVIYPPEKPEPCPLPPPHPEPLPIHPLPPFIHPAKSHHIPKPPCPDPIPLPPIVHPIPPPEPCFEKSPPIIHPVKPHYIPKPPCVDPTPPPHIVHPIPAPEPCLEIRQPPVIHHKPLPHPAPKPHYISVSPAPLPPQHYPAPKPPCPCEKPLSPVIHPPPKPCPCSNPIPPPPYHPAPKPPCSHKINPFPTNPYTPAVTHKPQSSPLVVKILPPAAKSPCGCAPPHPPHIPCPLPPPVPMHAYAIPTPAPHRVEYKSILEKELCKKCGKPLTKCDCDW